LHGKAMSYNNYVDAAAAWRAAFDFVQPCVAIIKHSNPCGIALGADLAEAHRKANASDPESAFGGVIAANGVVTAEMAAQVAEVFTEIVIAPEFAPEALEVLKASKNLRLLACPPPAGRGQANATGSGAAMISQAEWRQVDGGLLLQTPDRVDTPGDDPAGWALKTGQPASPDMLADLTFAWRAIRSVKSNAILLAAGLASVGVGMGQVSRVDAARLAVSRAGERAAGTVAASDAYFPFPDGLEVLIQAGVRAVVQPGGSVRDQLSIEAAEQAGITMYFTGVRHFYH
jgi:phosphoribosylaminoimidazolecarboxamide formyltransferase/IMP cyclohydrolase